MADGTIAKDAKGCATNVSSSERKASLALAGLLMAAGIRRLPLSGLLLLAVGGAMAFRGSTGYCPLYDTLDVDTIKPKEKTQ